MCFFEVHYLSRPLFLGRCSWAWRISVGLRFVIAVVVFLFFCFFLLSRLLLRIFFSWLPLIFLCVRTRSSSRFLFFVISRVVFSRQWEFSSLLDHPLIFVFFWFFHAFFLKRFVFRHSITSDNLPELAFVGLSKGVIQFFLAFLFACFFATNAIVLVIPSFLLCSLPWNVPVLPATMRCSCAAHTTCDALGLSATMGRSWMISSLPCDSLSTTFFSVGWWVFFLLVSCC